MQCINCGREIYGFWIYGPTHVCSMACFRKLIAEGKVSRIPPDAAFSELGIMPPNKFHHGSYHQGSQEAEEHRP